MRALLVYPTHANCAEVLREAHERGLQAAVYPPRLTVAACGKTDNLFQATVSINCWNPDADVAEAMGFPVVKTICPSCPQRKRCQQAGYLRQLIHLKTVDVALCTHKRLEHSGCEGLAADRDYVSIHEHPLHLLRPFCKCSETDLRLVQVVNQRLLNDPHSLNWFGNSQLTDDEGNPYQDEETARRRERLYEFMHTLNGVVDSLVTAVEQAESLTPWPVPPSEKLPVGIERLLYRTCRRWKIPLHGQPWQFVLGAASGSLESAVIQVNAFPQPKNGEPRPPVKTLLGCRSNLPPTHCITWFNDATISCATLSAALQRPVQDLTPVGTIPRQRKAVQIPRDITRKSSPRIFANVVRGVLADRPQFERIGLITHSTCLPAIEMLGEPFQTRIVRTTYFGSGEERSSNAWHTECDLIVIAGTPRIPTSTVMEALIQVGDLAAATREAVWGPLRWMGTTESGELVEITGRGYHDEDWRRVHRELVRATLVQAIGRGRGILESGCEVLVLSTEECGLPLSDAAAVPLSSQMIEVLAELNRASAENSYKPIKENSAVSTDDLAQRLGFSPRRVREFLTDLERRGKVLRVGDRGGWLPVRAENELISTAALPGDRHAEPSAAVPETTPTSCKGEAS